MKKLFIIIALVSYSFIGYTQDLDSITFRKNGLKFSLMNLPFRSVSFEYERMIDPNYSLILGVGLPYQGMISGKYGTDNTSKLRNVELGTMHIRAALRYYYNFKMLPKGFYVEPYLKYQQIKGTANYVSNDELNKIYKGDLVGKVNTINVGVQFGVQFLIAKMVTLDFYFIGLEGGLANGNITSTSVNAADAEKIETDFKDEVAGFPFFIENWVTVKRTNNQVFVDAKDLQYPWFRGGLSIGIAF